MLGESPDTESVCESPPRCFPRTNHKIRLRRRGVLAKRPVFLYTLPPGFSLIPSRVNKTQPLETEYA